MTRCCGKRKLISNGETLEGGPGENAIQCYDVCERSSLETRFPSSILDFPSAAWVLGHTHLGALANRFYLHWQQMKRLLPPLLLRPLTILVINICVMDFFHIFVCVVLLCGCHWANTQSKLITSHAKVHICTLENSFNGEAQKPAAKLVINA